MNEQVEAGTQEYVPRSQYEELGNEAADLKLERDAARRERDMLRARLSQVQGQIDQVDGLSEEKRDKVMLILMQDLEDCINMLKRYAYALGIQPGGILYEQVQALARKYKMGDYRPPADYSYEELVKPEIKQLLESDLVVERRIDNPDKDPHFTYTYTRTSRIVSPQQEKERELPPGADEWQG